MENNKHLESFEKFNENLNPSDASENSTWDNIFERLAIKSNNFEEFWQECEKIKSEYIEIYINSMKYLKRFNEELKPETYLKAADQLKKYHPERANRLRRHALNDDYSKFGPLNLIMGVGGYSKMNTPASTVKIGQYNISAMDFGLDITQDNFPIKDLYFHVFFQNVVNSDDRKVLNIIVPYTNGTFQKGHVSFWEAEDIVLFADRASALKFKKALHHFVYQSKSFYNDSEQFSFRETLYRQLDDLSHDPEMEFNFDDLAFNDLLKSITLDHLSLNKLFSTSTERFQLPATIE